MATTLTNSEGYEHNYTNEQLETILVGLNASNIYYTNGKKRLNFYKVRHS